MRKILGNIQFFTTIVFVFLGLVCIAGLLFGGCGGVNQREGHVFPGNRGTTTIVFADNYPIPDRAEFMIGLRYWSCLGVDYTLEPGGQHLEIRRTETHNQIYGYYTSDGFGHDYIYIDLSKAPYVDRLNRIVVAAHEFGHAIGMRHLDPPDDHSVMNSIAPAVKHLSKLDVEQFDAFWGEDHTGYDCPDVENAY